jgi:hypothetical protein
MGEGDNGGAERLSEAVVPLPGGGWFCRAPITIHGPGGQAELTPGATYRAGRVFGGIDVAWVLDSWRASGRLPPSFTAR